MTSRDVKLAVQRAVKRALRTLDDARRHGFRLHLRRLVDAPRVEADTTDSSSLRLSGVVCTVCATRTEAALRSVPGVEGAVVDLEGSRATLRLSPGATVDAAALQQAVEGVVVGMSARRRIEQVAGAVRRLRLRLTARN